MKVSAVVVSRMDRPIGAVLDSILPHVEELIVVRGHEGVWERWTAMERAKYEVVYTQDDDAIVDVPAVIAQHEADLVTCNMPEAWRKDYQDGIALVGWGAVFNRYRIDTHDGDCRRPVHECWRPFQIYFDWKSANRDYPYIDPVFRRECDRVFTGLSKLKLIDVPIEHQPWANGDDRMCRRAHDPVHGQYLQEIRRRIYAIRASV